jgi:sn-glycerol 3-phosphate transport system permease protein
VRRLETAAAWLLGFLWILPLAYAFWTAFHPPEFSTRFALAAPLTLDNFRRAWDAAPFARYFLNSFMLVTMVLAAQLVSARSRPTPSRASISAARMPRSSRARAAHDHAGRAHRRELPHDVAPRDPRFDPGDRVAVHGLRFRHLPAAPDFQDGAARARRGGAIEGAGPLAILWKVYVPLARPVYLAFGLVSVSYHWNNFLWPLIITSSVNSRPVTVGLQVFSSGDQGIDWSVITAATLMTSAPLLVGFLLFQRQFVQSFMRAGIK